MRFRRLRTCGDQSKQVTTRCLDQRSSTNCLFRDSFAPACISLDTHTHSQTSRIKQCILSFRWVGLIVTPPSPPCHGHCSRRRHPRVRTERAQWCVCCDRKTPWTPPSAEFVTSPPLLAHEGALHSPTDRRQWQVCNWIKFIPLYIKIVEFLILTVDKCSTSSSRFVLVIPVVSHARYLKG